MLVLSSLTVYPVKSCAGILLERAELDRRGIVGDRAWMVVDAQGKFLTQREAPRLALVRPSWQEESLCLEAPGLTSLCLPARDHTGVRMQVQVWRDVCQAVDQGDDAAQFFSTWLDRPVRLVRMADDAERQVDPLYARQPAITGFADGFPLLLISEASLADLNRRLDTPVPMNRFRPNLVVRGCAPYAEDEWQQLRLNDVVFDVVKPCARCAIPTTDQTTAERGVEPLRSLAQYRRVGQQVMFGQNVIHRGVGILEVGATIEVI